MVHMPPLFDEHQQLNEFKLVDSLVSKSQEATKPCWSLQVFTPETEDLETLVEHCKRSDTTDKITMAKFSASDEESDTKRHK